MQGWPLHSRRYLNSRCPLRRCGSFAERVRKRILHHIHKIHLLPKERFAQPSAATGRLLRGDDPWSPNFRRFFRRVSGSISPTVLGSTTGRRWRRDRAWLRTLSEPNNFLTHSSIFKEFHQGVHSTIHPLSLDRRYASRTASIHSIGQHRLHDVSCSRLRILSQLMYDFRLIHLQL